MIPIINIIYLTNIGNREQMNEYSVAYSPCLLFKFNDVHGAIYFGYLVKYGTISYSLMEEIVADLINNPDHYTLGRKHQPLDVMEDWGLIENHYLSCAFKYISRCGRKDDAVLDLKKAVFYLQREIERRGGSNILTIKRKL
jgi:hypothetical protein